MSERSNKNDFATWVCDVYGIKPKPVTTPGTTKPQNFAKPPKPGKEQKNANQKSPGPVGCIIS